MSIEQMKTYSQMEEFARTIHPDAVPRLNEFTDTWEIVISTEFYDSFELDDKFLGTPAAEAYNEPDTSYDNQLSRWGAKNGHYGKSLHDIAEAYNGFVAARGARYEQAEAFMKENNIRPIQGLSQEELDNLSDQERKKYQQLFMIVGW
jgi:hypothetical protein